MTLKDYILIAGALNDSLFYAQRPESRETFDFVTAKVANALERDNPNFDRYHFLAVVNGEKSLTSRPSRG